MNENLFLFNQYLLHTYVGFLLILVYNQQKFLLFNILTNVILKFTFFFSPFREAFLGSPVTTPMEPVKVRFSATIVPAAIAI